MRQPFLTDPQLGACGVEHGFGQRESPPPDDLVRPRQVHGTSVARAAAGGEPVPAEADAILAAMPGVAVGVVTADCLPVLVASADGRAAVAIHAGWKGLAAGVIEAGVAALRGAARGAELHAAVGPHVGACCYEVDGPVTDALARRFGAGLEAALAPSRPGHVLLDLGALARRALVEAGLDPGRVGAAAARCTRCDPEHFHSYRRDGPRAGRLVHFARTRRQS